MSIFACPASGAACGEVPGEDGDDCREWKWQVREDNADGGASILLDCCLTQEQAEDAAEKSEIN
tara:strand:- start:843 stop:1034 length:192 start_codon:yes stop_codon:yes gene_type:complete